MQFDRDIEAFIKSFVKDLSNRSAAIFAGAGLSKSAGYVDWPELLRDIAEELGLDVDKEHDLISLAQYHINHKGGNKAGIVKKILEEFSEQAEPTENHKLLSRLPISTCWTTNYDSLIEDSLKSAYKVVDKKYNNEHLATTWPKRDVVLYKMHGDIQDSTKAIIAKEQYEQYHKTHEPFITALSGDLISKTFLFIGFSFTDPNLDYVLSRLHVSAENRQHYCFMKKVEKEPGDDDEIFNYKSRKQDLRIHDLKRYRIQTLLVDKYSDITEILREIEIRYRKKTIFISGSAEQYGSWDRNVALKFIHTLSKSLVSNNFRIVNGFGWGVGSAVINGALEAVYANPEKLSEDQLIMRPFPQFASSPTELKDLWEEYRQRMISLAGIAVFVFGNKIGPNGDVIDANGVVREFEIACQNGLIPIPIGATGYAAKAIFNLISQSPEKYFGEQTWIFPLITELNDDQLTPEALHEKVMNLVKQLNR